MTLPELLSLLTRIVFVILAFLTWADFIRLRRIARLDIALAFTSLIVNSLFQTITQFTGWQASWFSDVGTIGVMAQPYLLLRVAHNLYPVPRLIRRAALTGLSLTIILILVSPTPLPSYVSLPLIIYFALVEGYDAVIFIRGSRASVGVTHQRFRLASIGTALLGLVILAAGFIIVIPALQPVVAPLLQLVIIASTISFYLGFSSPRWLLNLWQLTELHRFLRESRKHQTRIEPREVLDTLCLTAKRVVGGLSALIAQEDAASGRLKVYSPDGSYLVNSLDKNDGLIGQVWQKQTALIAETTSAMGTGTAQIAETLGAQTLLIIPIVPREQTLGVLLVWLSSTPLFIHDDLELLTLLAEQSGRALDYLLILDQQRLWNEQLQISNQSLEAANKELEAFTYSVSHDMRAPLRHVAGYIDLLERQGISNLDEKSRRYLKTITESAERMGALIDDLLAFSRVSRSELKKADVDLPALVEGVINELKSEVTERLIHWKIESLPTVYADHALLRLALLNLISNAIKYTRPRSPAVIEIGCRMNPDEAVLFIRDNGVGFDMKYVDKLFGVFQRLHHSDEFEGTGIGLANVRRIIAKHGGRTWAESSDGGGATFYLSLPDERSKS